MVCQPPPSAAKYAGTLQDGTCTIWRFRITTSKLECDFKLANTESTLWLGIKYFCIQAIIIHYTSIISQCRISVYQCRSEQDVGGSSSLQGTCTLLVD